MSDWYHIKTTPTPGRFRRVGKFGSIDQREDCARCSNCVKQRCPHGVYRSEASHDRDPVASIRPLYECHACLSCVQGCTKGLLGLCVNPEYLDLGDDYWQPDVLDVTWKQADSGCIPVSGAGYRGPFHGPGFDSMWTDVSGIVKWTRANDIEQEAINTSVTIRPRLIPASAAPNDELLTGQANTCEVLIPAILDLPPWQLNGQNLTQARLQAAAAARSLALVRASEIPELTQAQLSFAVPLIETADLAAIEGSLGQFRIVMLEDGPQARELSARVARSFPKLTLGVRMPLGKASQARILEYAQEGITVFQLCADSSGRAQGPSAPRHTKDVLRELHGTLLAAGVRDRLTLIVSGGIALAEHMVKSLICGADLVALDVAVLVALGCRVCRDHNERNHRACCPADFGLSDDVYAAQRIVNLLGAWRSQLVVVLVAMGVSDVGRLRGEFGHAIFMEDIEREAFGDLVRRQH